MNKIVLLLYFATCLLANSTANAQVYEVEKTQHRFAQTYLGMNSLVNLSGGELILQNETRAFPEMLIPRITIGGLHFWGKWDFKISFPVTVLGDFQLDRDTEMGFTPGGDLGARYYPWRLKYGKPRPFIGVMFNENTLALKDRNLGDREDYFLTTSMVAGLSYAVNDWQINAEVLATLNPVRSFYTADQQKRLFRLPGHYLSIGIIRYFDGSLKQEAPKLNGETDKLAAKLAAKGKLNSLSLGIAPSKTYFLKAPEYEGSLISLPGHNANFNWEFSIGYLFYKLGVHLGLSHRQYTANVRSYGLKHVLKRRSIALEGLVFLWDYNGFVPFIGASISLERWISGYFINDVQQGLGAKTVKVSPGILFGWDILTSPLDKWILRTNLRYYPFQRIDDRDNRKVRVDQFEFNFIQLVIYPGRIKNVPGKF